ncbi:MAG: HU family DNA-binding protein [Tannerella sp.]|jgi:predicted histone-like DNA-binding protein|nr:HU family DNA-binding protein [Tannerella sp.]
MSIYYRLDEQTDNMHPEQNRKRGLYPRIIRKKTVTLRELSQTAAEGTSFHAIEVESVGRLLIEGIVEQLRDGNNVCLDDFGTFSLSAETVRPALNVHDIRAESIRVKRIVFKTSQRLMQRLSGFRFVRKPKL